MNINDRKFFTARIWSNDELKKIAHLFEGKICNVSAWEDKDKQGKTYKEYFTNASLYSITNFYQKSARGSQGNIENEIIVNLTDDLRPELDSKFNVVFNHTTLEHIFECSKAFENLCKMSDDIVIVVVPFLQETHGNYGDYWRFTPQGIDYLFKSNGMETIYLSYNDSSKDSIYIFAVGTKKPDKWSSIKTTDGNMLADIYTNHAGTKIIKDGHLFKLRKFLSKIRA